MTFCQQLTDTCDVCGEPSTTGAICPSCIHDREQDIADDRRKDGEL